MNGDGSDQRLIADQSPSALFPRVAPDGRFIIFEGTDDAGDRIWRIDITGDSATPITPGPVEIEPVISPDGSSVYYTSISPGRSGAFKVAVDGGEPTYVDRIQVQLADSAADGRLLALVYPEHTPQSSFDVTVAQGRPGSWQAVHEIPRALHPLHRLRTLPVRFSGDDKGVLYCQTREGRSNIWRKSLAGGNPQQVTAFDETGQIFWFDLSHDGGRLAVARGIARSEVVLIRPR
jgi:Tol biopolymer transport system component